MSTTGTQRVLGQGQVAFDVPAEPSSLRLLRLGVADRAAAMGLGTEAIERARVVVDELAAVLLTAAPTTRLHVVMSVDGGRLQLDGAVDHRGPVPQVDQVVRELMDLCVGPEGWDVQVGGGRLTFSASIAAR